MDFYILHYLLLYICHILIIKAPASRLYTPCSIEFINEGVIVQLFIAGVLSPTV